jgi:acetoin utilization protein AcuB
MLVGERMTKHVLTITQEVPVSDALTLMHKEKIRRLPVVDKRNHLVGIVSESDLLNAQPSEATTLSVWEIASLLNKITVERVMTRKVATVTEDTPIEEAARIMADMKIGGLPVMKGDKIVGIITETNLFRIFLELLGARSEGTRVSVMVRDEVGGFARLTSAVRDCGGNIIAFVSTAGDAVGYGQITMKVSGVKKDVLKKALLPLVDKIIDIR